MYNRSRGRRVTVNVLICLGILALAGAVTTPVVAQQKIRAYTSFDEPLAREILRAFEQETGIKIEWIRLSSGDVAARLEAMRSSPEASLWYGAPAVNHIGAKEEGFTAPYASPNASLIPEPYKDRAGFWTGVYVNPLGFASNTPYLKQRGLKAPRSWADLLKPEYKGHIQIANPGTSGTAYTAIVTLVFLMGEEKAFAYLKALHKNISQYTRWAPAKAAGLGQTGIGIAFAGEILTVVSQGHPVELTFPAEGTGYEIAAISLVKGSSQSEIARKLYDWALSKRAAAVYAGFLVTPLVDVPLPPQTIPLALLKTVPFDHAWAGKNKKRLVEKWNNEVFASR